MHEFKLEFVPVFKTGFLKKNIKFENPFLLENIGFSSRCLQNSPTVLKRFSKHF